MVGMLSDPRSAFTGERRDSWGAVFVRVHRAYPIPTPPKSCPLNPGCLAVRGGGGARLPVGNFRHCAGRDSDPRCTVAGMDEATEIKVASEGADDLAPPAAATPTKKGAGREIGKSDQPDLSDTSARDDADGAAGTDGSADQAAAPEVEPAAVTVTEPEAVVSAPVELLVVEASTVPDLPIQFPVREASMGTSRIMVVTKLGLRATQQFDARVADLVRSRQADAGLPVTGIVDEATFKIL